MVLEKLYLSAVGYMIDAGVREPVGDPLRKAKYDLCVDYIVLDAWDTRVTTITGTIVAENPAFRKLLNQLKYTELPMEYQG